MSAFRTLRIVRAPYVSLGMAVQAELERWQPSRVTVIAVVPTLLTYFGPSPERYEVTAADVIVQVDE